MSDNRRPGFGRSLKLLLLTATVAISGGLGYAVFGARQTVTPPTSSESAEATAEEVHRLCGACHAYPPPDTFPRSAWRKEVKQGYDFFHKDPSHHFDYPPLEAVVRYYQNRAPEAL